MADILTTLKTTVTIVEPLTKTAHRPLETLLSTANDSTHSFDVSSGPLWESIIRVTLLLITCRVAWSKFLIIATYINNAFRDWLDVAPGPARKFKARAVFWFMVTVYLVTLTNVGLFLFEQLSQILYLMETGGHEHVGLVGAEWSKFLLAGAGVLATHKLQSEEVGIMVQYGKREARRPEAVLREPVWSLVGIFGLTCLVLSEFCSGVLRYQGALAVTTEALLVQVSKVVWAAKD